MFQAKRLLEAQGVAMVVIIVAMPAEKPVARFFVARNRPGVVLVDFEAHRPPTSALRCLLCCSQQERPDAASLKVGGDDDGIKPGDRGARWIKHQHVADEFAAVLGDDQRGLP